MLTYIAAVMLAASSPPSVADTGPRPPQRPAIEYSDAYYTRLTIHRYGSYTMLPLFATEYYLGQRLLSDSPRPGWLKPTHVGVASGIGALFTLNTITGVWNLWDSRHDPADRKLRILHSTLMLASDAGFALAAAVADDDDEGGGGDSRTLHRNIALGSIGIATVGTAIMWVRNR